MKIALIKDTLREIKTKRTQFISLLLIIALGVSFYIGIRVTGSDMRDTAEDYYQTSQLMDVQLISTLGFDEDSITLAQESITNADIEGVKSTDQLVNVQGQDYALRITALGNTLNQSLLLAGRYPENDQEIVADDQWMTLSGLEINDVLTLPGESDLSQQEFTIVGRVESPLFLNIYRGSSSVGDGNLDGFAFVDPATFTSEVYASVSFRLKSAANSFSDEYTGQIEALKAQITALQPALSEQRLTAVKAPYQEEIDEQQTTLDEAIADAESEFLAAQQQINQSRVTLNDASIQIDEGLSELFAGIGASEPSGTQTERLAAFKDAYAAFKLESENNLSALNQQLIDLQEQLAALQANNGDAQTITTLNGQIAALSSTYQQQSAGYAQATQTIDYSITQLESAISSQQEGMAVLNQSQQSLNQQKEAAEDQFATAQTDIDKAQTDLNNQVNPTYYGLTRQDSVVGYADFQQDSDRIEAIGQVFPVIFFLVAALVCLSSMKRMVEEQRTQSGILKALGYNSGSIMLKYVMFSGIACAIGLVIGIFLGFYVIPYFIYNAYRILYRMPDLLMTFKISYFWLPMFASLVCSVGVAVVVSLSSSRQTPAVLMRPLAPKPGKRVILEYVPWLWSRLKFLHKVTIRNLLLDRSRFMMSIIGVAGCTGLLITGLGIDTSVNTIMSKQFVEITHYDLNVSLESDISEAHMNEVLDLLANHQGVNDDISLYATNVTAIGENKNYETTMMILDGNDNLDSFISLKDLSGNAFEMDNNGIVIDQKLAELLNVTVGDSVQVELESKDRVMVNVSHIMENYLAHQLMMTQDYAESLNITEQKNTVMVNLNDNSSEAISSISSDLLSISGVIAITDISQTQQTFSDMMGSFNIVIVIICGAAALLAFVVMTNLVTMNIQERIKELATLKVLGFYDRETNLYVVRENTILVVLGSLVGCIFGYYLHRYVISTVEVDLVMFNRQITWTSFVIALALTYVFAAIVNFTMYFVIRKVNMVEALKSVD